MSAANAVTEALRRMLEIFNDECRLDHHGNCQAHFLDVRGRCRVAEAKAALAASPTAQPDGEPDTARLDWLERTVREHGEVELVWSDAGDECIDGHKVSEWPASFDVFGHGAGHDRPTLRAAIDAAARSLAGERTNGN